MTEENRGDRGQQPLIIAEQGSFMVGGRIVKADGRFDLTRFFVPFKSSGQTYSIEHLYAQFQIPPNARKLPLLMVHGGCQTGKLLHLSGRICEPCLFATFNA